MGERKEETGGDTMKIKQIMEEQDMVERDCIIIIIIISSISSSSNDSTSRNRPIGCLDT